MTRQTLLVRGCGTAEEEEPGADRARLALRGQQVADEAQALQMLHAHNLVPLGFTDREHRLGSRVRVAEQDYVQLVANLASRVADGARSHPDRDAAKCVLRAEETGPIAAKLLEVRAKNITGEAVLTALPEAAAVPGSL
jgi:hypothetical protein